MARWQYNITVHELPLPEQNTDAPIIACDQAGHCFVHDASEIGVGWLEDLFSKKGEEGWDLVQLGYHKGRLLCIWKREAPPEIPG